MIIDRYFIELTLTSLIILGFNCAVAHADDRRYIYAGAAEFTKSDYGECGPFAPNSMVLGASFAPYNPNGTGIFAASNYSYSDDWEQRNSFTIYDYEQTTAWTSASKEFKQVPLSPTENELDQLLGPRNDFYSGQPEPDMKDSTSNVQLGEVNSLGGFVRYPLDLSDFVILSETNRNNLGLSEVTDQMDYHTRIVTNPIVYPVNSTQTTFEVTGVIQNMYGWVGGRCRYNFKFTGYLQPE